MENSASYIKQLQFEKKLEEGFIAKYFGNIRLLILILLSVIGIGIASFLSLPRELNPDVKIPLVIVSTILPGASPADIESLVTIPIEDSVSGLPDVQTVSSTSRDSVSITTIEFSSSVDVEKARADVQSAIDTVENLPEDAENPVVQKLDFQNQPILILTLTGKNDTASLVRFSQELEGKIDDLSSVERVTTSGIDEQEVQIVLKPQAISSYRLNPLLLQQQIKSATGSFPAGTVKTTSSAFTLSIDPAITTIDDIRNLLVSVTTSPMNMTTRPVPLSQLADVTLIAKPDQKESYFANKETTAQKAVTMSIYKSDSSNITTAVEDVEKIVEEEGKKHEGQFFIQPTLNTGEEITEQFNDLTRDFILTVLLVFIVLFVFLGARQAIVSLLSAPLTFLISFIVMNMTGITLNFISLFSLLLSLGLLVDDTIVVISAMTAYFRSGRFTPLQTGLLVWRDFGIAILTTTITTVWAFVPLLLASGIIGEFIKPIPIVVSATLLASLFVAMFITLPLMIYLLHPTVARRVKILLQILVVIILLGVFFYIIPKGWWLIPEILALILFLFVTRQVRFSLAGKTEDYFRERRRRDPILKAAPALADHGLISFERISERYKRGIYRILMSPTARRLTLIMVIIFSIFSYLLVPLGFVRNEFFPKTDTNTLYVSVELPTGTNLETSEEEAKRLLNELRTIPELEFAIAQIGQNISSDGFAEAESNNILITLTLLEDKERTSIELADALREQYAGYSEGRFSVVEQSGGPPAGADVQIQLLGDDLTVLQEYAGKVETHLKNTPGTTNVDRSIKSGTSKLVYVPDKERVASTGVSTDQLGLWLRIFASGMTADSVTFSEDSDDTDISIRMAQGAQTPEAISLVSLPTMTGDIVSLSELGTIKLEPNPSLITREDGKRSIAISASVKQGFSISEINQGLEGYAQSTLSLPSGYTWKTGGVNEENQRSVNSILQAMLVSFLLIVITMVLQFGSFRKALIVMLVIPLSISGVFIMFALTQTPLSFPALIGILALFGIVVKNAILIVDKINQNNSIGMKPVAAIADAASSRLEAIALTTLATIMGLIPITVSDPLWRGLGGAIIAGLTFSGTIMLFFIPVVYYYWFVPKTSSVKNIPPLKVEKKKRGRPKKQ